VTVPLLGVDETPHNLGGRLCLSVVNSLWWRRSEAPIEQLNAYADVVDAVAKAGWLDDPAELADQAARRPMAARRALQRAVALREDLALVFAAVTAGDPPPEDALAAVEAVSARGFAHLTLTPAATPGYRLRWDRPALDVPAQQVAVSAVLLLASDELDRVKQCDGPTCGWVFLDTSRNRSRRWCDSRECGNRERVRAHYVRTHSS
jgi:predicted RNA-binding Zn ribbon-like protein